MDSVIRPKILGWLSEEEAREEARSRMFEFLKRAMSDPSLDQNTWDREMRALTTQEPSQSPTA